MSQRILKSALIAAALTLSSATVVRADEPVEQAGYAPQDQSLTYLQTQNGVPADGSYYGYNYSVAYPPIQAPLYPCPKPNVPYEVGRTVITNPALAPHEMLYAHRYRALYPPYYYCNKCGLACLPFIPKPPLRGTEVTVKYKSHLGCWYPPCRKICYSNRQWR